MTVNKAGPGHWLYRQLPKVPPDGEGAARKIPSIFAESVLWHATRLWLSQSSKQWHNTELSELSSTASKGVKMSHVEDGRDVRALTNDRQ